MVISFNQLIDNYQFSITALVTYRKIMLKTKPTTKAIKSSLITNYFPVNYSIGPEKNKKITSMMKKTDKATSYRKTCGYLTNPEIEEYLSMYPNPDQLFKSLPKLPKRKELWNKKGSEILEDLSKSLEKSEKQYNLSEWNMWQNADQERLLVSKSKKSQIFCQLLRNQNGIPENEESDDEIKFIEQEDVPKGPILTPIEFDEEEFGELDQAELDENLNEILGDDPYREKYDFFNFPGDPPMHSKIDEILNKLPSSEVLVSEGFDLIEALRSFRKRTMDRSPSPVFLSQSQIIKERETSTPLATAKGELMNVKLNFLSVTNKNIGSRSAAASHLGHNSSGHVSRSGSS